MSADSPALRIGDAAQRSGISAANIRYYEKEMLLSPCSRSANSYRLYIDILPALKDGDSCCQAAMSRRENVPCCIHVAVVYRTALAARPFPYSQTRSTFRTAGGNNSAARASLG
jgi:hypothetical protein